MSVLLVTREADYALRILRALAGGEQRTAADICEQEQIPDKFVYKIAKKLEKSGFIKIVRGAEGGCRLIVDLHTMSLYDLSPWSRPVGECLYATGVPLYLAGKACRNLFTSLPSW